MACGLAALELARVALDVREALLEIDARNYEMIDALSDEVECYERDAERLGRQAALELSTLPMGYGLNWPLN